MRSATPVTIDGRGLLDDQEAGKYLGLSRSHFRRLVGLGELPGPRVRRPRLVRWAAEDLVDARERLMGSVR